MQRTLRRPQRDCIRFFLKETTGTTAGRTRIIKSIIGELPVSEKQVRKLKLNANQKISPYLEECCLRASANVSDDNAAKDIQKYTGMSISASTQTRIVQRYEFGEVECDRELEEISVDGGKVRLRTETKGEPCVWKDYKADAIALRLPQRALHQAAICINQEIKLARLGENEILIDWVNHQNLAEPLTCLGDGHPGIWKIVREFNCPGERREILDWFHLIENLHKVAESAALGVSPSAAPFQDRWFTQTTSTSRDFSLEWEN